MTPRLLTSRLLSGVLTLLPVLAFAQAAPRTPLLIDGKQSLYQRVIARPGATLSAQSDGQNAHPVPGFTVYYVYAKPPGSGDTARIEVGRTADGHPEGWLQASKAIEWKHTMVAAFTNPAGRQPVLFLRSERDERLLMMDGQAGERAQALRTAATVPGADPGPVLAIEPAAAVDFARNFYLMPILSAERIEREFGPPLRLLEVISAPAEGQRPPAPPAAASQFKAGVVFVLDTTISMQPYIDRTREAIRGIVASVGSTPVRDNFRFGLVAYRDSLDDSPGLEYSTRIYGKPDFTQPPDSINTGVATAREATASSNGFDEDPIGGIKAALDEIDWSPMAGRYIVLVTDAGARPAQHPHSLTHLNIAEIRELAKAKGVAVFAIHLLTPEGRARHDHEPAAAQYRELTQFGAAGPLYFPVPNGAPDAFARTVQELTRALLSQVGEAAGRPVTAPTAANPALQDAVRVVGEAMRLTYLGRAQNTQAPDVVRSWTTDRDLKDPAISSLDVRVLLTRNQLSDLARSLQAILQAGLAGRTEPRTFFTQLRATFAAAARDPQRIAGAQRIGALLGEYLDDLPYQSEIMDIQEADWVAMGAIAQRTVLNSVEAKLRLYQEFQSNADLWVDLSGSRTAGEALFPVPIEALP
jgi:hypothetical protein